MDLCLVRGLCRRRAGPDALSRPDKPLRGAGVTALAKAADVPACRACGAALTRTSLDLGLQPLANAFVAPERAGERDRLHPLHVRVCDLCLLVQADAVVTPEE